MRNPHLLPTLLLASAAFTLGLPEVASAAAGSDLSPAFIVPLSARVYDPSHVDVRITNGGSRTSGPVTVTIELPRTNTSPTVHVMGTVLGVSPGCALLGTRITCTLAGIAKNRAATVGFDIRLPYSMAPLSFRADVSTNNDTNPANNAATHAAAQTYWTVPAPTASALITNSHCTGTNLSSFFECVLYPSSLMSHPVLFIPVTANAGTIDFGPNGPDYAYLGGTWSVSGTSLAFQYTDGGLPVATFVGQGTAGNCWEGKTIFTAGGEAMYRVCR